MDTIDYDKFGHCSCCHKNMIIEEVVGGKVIKRFTPEYSEVEYLLNDGSKMRVSVCNTCQLLEKHKDTISVMNCVIKGWKVNIDELVKDETKLEWTKEKADSHMKIYSKKEIIVCTKGHDEDSLKVSLDNYINNIESLNVIN